MNKVRDPKVDEVLAESFIPSKLSAALTQGIEQIYDRLGKPTDASNEVGWKMVDELVKLWYTYYPWELKAWKESVLDDLELERDVHTAIKENGGYFPISYPTRLYKMLDTYLPNQKLHDRSFIKKMVLRHPVFKTTNYKV